MTFRTTLLAALLSAAPAAAQVPQGWQAVPAKLVETNAGGVLEDLSAFVPCPAPSGVFLFEAGRDWRYEVKDGSTLELFLGGKKGTVVKEGEPVKLAAQPPGERAPVKLVFRRLASAIEGAPAVRAAQVVVAKAGSKTFTFIDIDSNGYFDDWGVDAVLEGDPKELEKESGDTNRANMRTFHGELSAGGSRFLATLRPATTLLLWPITEKIPQESAQHMGYLNYLRRQCGLGPVGIDEPLSEGCAKHASYCKKNGPTHDENKNLDGYTPEGERAGKGSTFIESNDVLEGLQRMLKYFYERAPYLRPNLRKVGLGWADGYYMCEMRTYSDRTILNPPLLYPADRQARVDPQAKPGNPDPKPAGLDSIEGTFIVATFAQDTKPELVEATLRDVTNDAAVEVVCSTPKSPPPAARAEYPDNGSCICICPRIELRNDTIYEVVLRYKVRAEAPVEERKWRFKTRPPV